METHSALAARYRMVVALDTSEYAEIVLEHAFDQAARHDRVDLHFLTVVGSQSDVDAAARTLARQIVDGSEGLGTSVRNWRTRLHVGVGDTVEEIINLAGDLDADLIVVGRFGAHRRRVLLTCSIVETAPCPVLVVGLTEHVAQTQQCVACAAVREATEGEQLFCAGHHGDPHLRSSSLLAWGSNLTHGRLW